MWILWRTIVVWLTVVRKREKEIQKESGSGCDTIISPSKSLWCICKESQFTYSWICWLVLACTLAGFAFVTLLSSSRSLLVYSLSLSTLHIWYWSLIHTYTHSSSSSISPSYFLSFAAADSASNRSSSSNKIVHLFNFPQ